MKYELQEWIYDIYKNNVKEKKYKDRENKILHMIKFSGNEKLISDLEIEKDDRKYIANLLKTSFINSPFQLTRCRQLLNQIFDYAEDKPNNSPKRNTHRR